MPTPVPAKPWQLVDAIQDRPMSPSNARLAPAVRNNWQTFQLADGSEIQATGHLRQHGRCRLNDGDCPIASIQFDQVPIFGFLVMRLISIEWILFDPVIEDIVDRLLPTMGALCTAASKEAMTCWLAIMDRAVQGGSRAIIVDPVGNQAWQMPAHLSVADWLQTPPVGGQLDDRQASLETLAFQGGWWFMVIHKDLPLLFIERCVNVIRGDT